MKKNWLIWLAKARISEKKKTRNDTYRNKENLKPPETLQKKIQEKPTALKLFSFLFLYIFTDYIDQVLNKHFIYIMLSMLLFWGTQKPGSPTFGNTLLCHKIAALCTEQQLSELYKKEKYGGADNINLCFSALQVKLAAVRWKEGAPC